MPLGFVWFVRERRGGRRVHSGAPSGWLGTLGRALWVVGVRLVHLGTGCRVHSGALWVSSVSFGFVGLIGVRPWCRGVHLGFVGFIRARPRCRLVHSGTRSLFIGVRWVHTGVPWGSSGSFALVEFIRERSVG